MRYSYDDARRGVFAAHQKRRHEHTGGREEESGKEGRKEGRKEERKEEGLMLGNRHACKMRRKKSGACGGSAAVQRPLSHSHTSATAIFHPERPQRLSIGIG